MFPQGKRHQTARSGCAEWPSHKWKLGKKKKTGNGWPLTVTRWLGRRSGSGGVGVASLRGGVNLSGDSGSTPCACHQNQKKKNQKKQKRNDVVVVAVVESINQLRRRSRKKGAWFGAGGGAKGGSHSAGFPIVFCFCFRLRNGNDDGILPKKNKQTNDETKDERGRRSKRKRW